MSKTWIFAIAAAVAILATAYLLRSRSSTDAVISSMEQAVEESKARADAIVSETAKKEVSARAQSRKTADRLNPDELCDAINEMLRCYRRSQ